jgi:hypothetical protein
MDDHHAGPRWVVSSMFDALPDASSRSAPAGAPLSAGRNSSGEAAAIRKPAPSGGHSPACGAQRARRSFPPGRVALEGDANKALDRGSARSKAATERRGASNRHRSGSPRPSPFVRVGLRGGARRCGEPLGVQSGPRARRARVDGGWTADPPSDESLPSSAVGYRNARLKEGSGRMVDGLLCC